MQIKSKLFGDIEIQDDKIITFEKGLMGFEELKKYALVFDSDKPTPNKIMWLQSAEISDLAFPVIDPTIIMGEYNPVVEDEWLAPIGEYDTEEDLLVLSILTVPSDISKMTANVKAPLIINGNTNKGCQIIANNDEYSVRFNVYDMLQKKKEEAGCYHYQEKRTNP